MAPSAGTVTITGLALFRRFGSAPGTVAAASATGSAVRPKRRREIHCRTAEPFAISAG